MYYHSYYHHYHSTFCYHFTLYSYIIIPIIIVIILIVFIITTPLDLRVPWWLTPFVTERLFLTKSLEWSLSFCILEYMFNEQFVISTSFLKNVTLLQTRLKVVGVLHMVLLPFMVIFMTIHFFLLNAQSFHSNKAYLGPRQWSPLALWTFREFNELPHIFNERINKSYEPSNEYILSFTNHYTAIIARLIVYLGKNKDSYWFCYILFLFLLSSCEHYLLFFIICLPFFKFRITFSLSFILF